MEVQSEISRINKYFVPYWVVTSLIVSILAPLVKRLFPQEILVLYFVLAGAAVGFLQWLIIRKYISKAWWWIVATTLGLTSLEAATPTIRALISIFRDNYRDFLAQTVPETVREFLVTCSCERIVYIYMLASMSLFSLAILNSARSLLVVFPQWLILRRRRKGSWPWLVLRPLTVVIVSSWISIVFWIGASLNYSLRLLGQDADENSFLLIIIFALGQIPIAYILGTYLRNLLQPQNLEEIEVT